MFQFLVRNFTDPDVMKPDHDTGKLIHKTMQSKCPEKTGTSSKSDSMPMPETYTWLSESEEELPTVYLTLQREKTLLVLTSVWTKKRFRESVHEKFDPVKNAWEKWECPHIDMGRGFEAAVVGHWLLIIGGVRQKQKQSTILIYDLKAKIWRSGPSMKTARFVIKSFILKFFIMQSFSFPINFCRL